MSKRPKALTHLKRKIGNHPASESRIIQHLEAIDDPRGASCNFRHPLTTVLFIVIACSLCGANNWEVIAIQAQTMSDWLKKYVDLSSGVPCAKTFKRIFETLSPLSMEKMLITVMNGLREKLGRDVISFDGKTLCGTVSALKAIHLLNAWSKESGICIGQIKVDDKSNEITAIPILMDLLDLKGTIITTDALNTQKNVALKAVEGGADYVLPVKGNHPTLQKEIEEMFQFAESNNFSGIDGDYHETLEKLHGRVEYRQYWSLDCEGLPSEKEWAKLTSLGKVVRKRLEGDKESIETHYYISSCEIDAQVLANATRSHWGVEILHWHLDVVFREDHSRYRERVGAQNLSVIRKIALSALARDKTLKCGKEGKRLVAATHPAYRDQLLKILF